MRVSIQTFIKIELSARIFSGRGQRARAKAEAGKGRNLGYANCLIRQYTV
jgi:hypothetical protein